MTDPIQTIPGLSQECKTALFAFRGAVHAYGLDHTNTLTAWRYALALDETGVLVNVQGALFSELRAQLGTKLTPEFMDAAKLLLHLHDALGVDHEETHQALARALELAPPEARAEMHQTAIELGLIPDRPAGFDAKGLPVYVGSSLVAALAGLPDVLSKLADLGLPAPGSVEHITHPIH